MNLSLRAKLRLPEGCSNQDLQDACNRYYALYKGILESAPSEAVRAVAGSKLEDLVDHARREGIMLENMSGISFEAERANINATVELELSAGKTLSPDKAKKLERDIAALPDSAKRYYLSALVILGKGEGTTESFSAAVKQLKSAASKDPGDIVYDAMLATLEREIVDYNTSLTAWKDAEQKRLDAIHRGEVFREVMSTIGAALLWVGGAILTVAGFIASCACSFCDAC